MNVGKYRSNIALTDWLVVLRNQLKVAKIVLLNKIDTVTSDDLDQIESDIRGFGFDGKVIRVRADTGEGMEGILEVMEL